MAGANRSEWSLFSRQNGRDYRGKSRTLLDHRGLRQNGARLRQSNLRFRIISDFGFEMQDSSNFKISPPSNTRVYGMASLIQALATLTTTGVDYKTFPSPVT